MANIKTKVFIVCENGNSSIVQRFDLPSDDRQGFYGELSIKLQSGRATSVNVPRQSLNIETITKEQWEAIFGEIEDRIEGIN